MTILVTGGAGFIGSNFVLDWLARSDETIVNLDLLTYAGNLKNLNAHRNDARHIFVRGNICDRAQVDSLLTLHQPRALVHFAAESHVDRSIHEPGAFVQTNVIGTWTLLEACRQYIKERRVVANTPFRFLHISTDEVYGSLEAHDAPFTEHSRYSPNSPYSASKAGSDHLVRSYFQTYGLDTVITNCSNNYGPYQFPEKLIPLMIVHALAGKPLPIYGDGQQVRDWLYVGDHCAAIRRVLDAGAPGETYNIGGWNEKTNLEVVQLLCALLDEARPAPSGRSRTEQITYVTDRLGHDRRYAIDASRMERELGWKPRETFSSGIRRTVEWYLANEAWTADVTSGAYRSWMDLHYGSAGLARR